MSTENTFFLVFIACVTLFVSWSVVSEHRRKNRKSKKPNLKLVKK